MAKAEVNNEIVLLRHTVRQARVCVINKLIKEARHLRNKHGAATREGQRDKYKRKADRLIEEVYTLKAIKDDDITKFGIINERELTEILQDPVSTNDIRIKARVAHYKTLHRRLVQFKEKYPDCKTYLMEEKKGAKLKANNAARTKRSPRGSNSQNKTPRKQTVNSDPGTESSQNDSEDEKVRETEARDAQNSRKRRKKSTSDESLSSSEGKAQKLEKEDTSQELDKRSSAITPRSITNEGTVKRFTELFEEQETKEDARTCAESSTPAATEQAKTVDDFFITGDNENYKTVSSAATQYEKSHRYNTRAKFQPNSRTKKQNGNDASVSKKNFDKQSSGMKLRKTTGNKINKGTDVTKEDANLHPSWLAKKKEQDMIRQGFQGKRIVFADD